MLLFLFPLEAGENRPLELEIQGEGEEGLTSSWTSSVGRERAQTPLRAPPRAAGAAVSPPAPLRTSSTATAIFGFFTGA